MPTEQAVWEGPPERLDRVVPELGLARSRSRAGELIAAGKVRVDGVAAGKPGTRVRPGSRVEISGADHYVSRAAHKLLAALDRFGVDPGGRLALDLGASTGGFTQVLLERGARAVQAVDVGHGQLDGRLRADARVRAVEGCNARELTAERLAALTAIPDRPSLVVADLSFISLGLILPAIARTASEDAELLLLVKPQFEVGRVRDGVVTNPEQWADAIRGVLRSAAEHGYAASGIEASPIAGGRGNREFLVRFVSASKPDPTEWEHRIDALCRGRADPSPEGAR